MQKRLRFTDLAERGIVKTRPTLARWIELYGFPPGRRTGPNTRSWGEDEVQAWLDARPVSPKKHKLKITHRPGRPAGFRRAAAESAKRANP